MAQVVHLQPKERLPDSMIVVGDPERASMIADEILESARVLNTKRGYTIYAGYYQGVEIGVGVHMIGGPSTAIFLEEIARLGVTNIVRIGSAGSLGNNIGVGSIVVPPSSVPASCGGIYHQYYGATCPPNAHTPEFVIGILKQLEKRGITPIVKPVVSSDAFYAEDEEFVEKWSRRGIVAVEMECATVAMIGWLRSLRQACVLVISNVLGDMGHHDTRRLWPIYKKVTESVLDFLVGARHG